MKIKSYREFLNESKSVDINEANISMYKSMISDVFKELDIPLKQSEFKVGVKKDGTGKLITLNGELLCSDTDYEQMKKWAISAIKEDPSRYDLDGYIKESVDFVLNEAINTADDLANFINKESKHFAAFLKPKKLSATTNGDIATIKPASGSFTITVDFGNSTIDTTGKPEYPESVSYVEILEYCKITKFKIIGESVEINENTTLSFAIDDHINHIHKIFTNLKNKTVERAKKSVIADAIAQLDRFDAKIAELSDRVGILNEDTE